MKLKFFKISVLVLLSTSGLLGPGQFASGQSRPSEPYRVLIDASKDGGGWWARPSRPVGEEQPHQGKAFADLLRQDGAEVTEIPKGDLITPAKLTGFDLVIRIAPYRNYSHSEAMAYRNSVAAGTRLLVMGGGIRNNDRIADVFGFEFDRRTHFSSLDKWIKHPFTAAIDERPEFVSSGLIRAPKEAVLLAWMEQTAPLLGYLPYGNGYVVFTGQVSAVKRANHPYLKGLINSMKRFSRHDLNLMQAIEVVTADIPRGTGPVLIEPANNADLPRPGDGEWRFDWEDVPGAEMYEVIFLGPSAHVPLGPVFTHKSEHTAGSRKPRNADGRYKAAYIADHNLRGWSWKVRAKLSNGKWGAWSGERIYNVRRQERKSLSDTNSR